MTKFSINSKMAPNESGIIRADRNDITQYRRILKTTREGKLIRLRNGLYAFPEALTGNIIDIDTIVPGGILCLYSAWNYYDLTTQVPDAYYVAIQRSRKVKLPVFPDIKLIFQRSELLSIGITETEQGHIRVRITDLERSVCDAIKYRNKTGIDVMSEIIDKYLRHPERNLSRLSEYAKKLRVYSTLYQYLQVKL